MENLKTLYEKLSKAKLEIGKISKDSKNPFFKSKYFDVNKLLEHVEPILQTHGLMVMQPLIEGCVVTQLIEVETGLVVESSIKLSEQKDPQKLGSEITYFRRYTLQSLLALQAEDDDGNKASKPTPKAKPVIKNLPKLEPVSENWDVAKTALKNKKTTITEIRKHYSLTDENELLILEN